MNECQIGFSQFFALAKAIECNPVFIPPAKAGGN
jgi:hypothetical protein